MNGSKTEIIIGDKVYVEKEESKVVINQVGYTYIFQIANIMRKEEQDKIRERIKEQLKEGVVFIDGAVKLVSVEPRLETFLEPQGKPW